MPLSKKGFNATQSLSCMWDHNKGGSCIVLSMNLMDDNQSSGSRVPCVSFCCLEGIVMCEYYTVGPCGDGTIHESY